MSVLVQKASSGCCGEVEIRGKRTREEAGAGTQASKDGAIPRRRKKSRSVGEGPHAPSLPLQGFRLAIFRAGNVLPTVPFFMAEIIDSEMLSGLGNTQKARPSFFFLEHPLPISTWTQCL